MGAGFGTGAFGTATFGVGGSTGGGGTSGNNPGVPGLGWGLQQFGVDPYGSVIAPTALTMQSAIAVSMKQVKVTLTADAQAIVSSLNGDALNPKTWTIQRLDTAAFLTVVAVQELTPKIFVITTIEGFGSHRVTHRVSSSTLLSVIGGVIQGPKQADFLGLVEDARSTPAKTLATRRGVVTDLANPQTNSTYRGVLGGTLQVGASGDYEPVAGIELSRKLLVRRFISTPGDFFHLPDYGLGLREKELVTVGDLARIKAETERQALREPEIIDPQAAVTVDSDNIFTLRFKGTHKVTGEDVNFDLPMPEVQVQL